MGRTAGAAGRAREKPRISRNDISARQRSQEKASLAPFYRQLRRVLWLQESFLKVINPLNPFFWVICRESLSEEKGHRRGAFGQKKPCLMQIAS